MRSIIDACIRFRLLVVALAVGLMVAGILRLASMPATVLPQTSPVTVDVQTQAPGLSAPEVEALVTVPLEKKLRTGVPGVTDVTSDSVPGLSAIELDFAPGTNMFRARQLVRERLAKAIAALNVSRPRVISQPVPTTSDVMLIGLTSTRLSLIDLSVLARSTIAPRLLGLPGVASVSTFGQADRQLQVLVNPVKLVAHHVRLAQIVQTVATARAATTALLPVAGAAPGVRLGEVAQLVQGSQPLVGDGQVRGGPGLVLVVQQSPGASVLAVTREVDQSLAAMEPRLPGVTVDPTLFRADTYLRSALVNLRAGLVACGVLAALALISLLLRLRVAFAALFGMALSLVAATVVVDALGYTFNALVTLGLLLALALVVTEAAGEAQAIVSRLDAAPDAGLGPRQPILRLVAGACADMRGALTVAGLAALVCVVPLLIASGTTAAFLRPMAVAFALAVIAAMVVAVTVTPALVAVLLTVVPTAPHGTALPRLLASCYGRAVGRVARAPRVAAVGAAALVALGVAGLTLLPGLHPQQPVFADRALVVRLTGPPGTSLTEMDQMTALASSELLALPAVQDVGATVGQTGPFDQVVGANTGLLWVTLQPDADYGQAVAAVSAVASGTPGLTGTVSTYESDSMAGVLTAAPASVVTRVYGSDYRELERLAGRLGSSISRISGVGNTVVQYPVEQPTVDVAVNPQAAARAGVSAADVRREAGTLLSDLTVGTYFGNQVVVLGTPAVRAHLASVGNLPIDTSDGGHVRLGQVARITVTPAPADIPHEATSRYLDVTAQVPGGQAGAVSGAISGLLASMRFPRGYHAELVTGTGLSGLSPNLAGASGTSRTAFVGYVIGALVIVLLLGRAATRSWRLAALAFGSLPVSLAGGVFVAHWLGATGSLAAAAGLLAVFALAVRQAIAVTVRQGSGVHLDGSGARLQDASDAAGGLAVILTPVVVTAVALVPFAVTGAVPGMELLRTAATVILGGLATITLVTLFGLPVACRLLGPHQALDSATALSAADTARTAGGEHAALADSGERARIPEER